MASTYGNDLRLEEIGDGEQSGTWGATTNTNLELIAEALSFGTEAITTNADTHTTTIADGATDPGRSLYLKYTGTLDSTCTITIAPNSISKTWYIENGTSGSQSIIISQGSGANVTIPTGQTKIVYSDGAGSGAAMGEIGTLGVTNLAVTTNATIGGNIIVSGTVDGVDLQTLNNAVTANTAKTGITSSQASAIVANTAKTGITSSQASAIVANTAKTTNATHTGEVTGSGALTIANNVVDEANLKVSNSPTNGYFLSAQSGNTGGLTWAEAGGGGTEHISTQTASSGASYITFTNYLSSSYSNYILSFDLLKNNGANSNYQTIVQVSANGGSSWLTATSAYMSPDADAYYGLRVDGGYAAAGGGANSQGVSGFVYLYALGAAANTTSFSAVATAQYSGSYVRLAHANYGFGARTTSSASAHNAIRIAVNGSMGTSTFVSGKVSLLGVKNS